MRTLVVAETYKEAEDWARSNGLNYGEFSYVEGMHSIAGLRSCRVVILSYDARKMRREKLDAIWCLREPHRKHSIEHVWTSAKQ